MLRIVSLVPSLTETLCHLGLEENLVGCTSFCCEPPGLRKKVESVGGTKDPNILRIVELKPTHVLVNTEENTTTTIRELKTLLGDAQVLESFPRSPLEAIECVRGLVETFDSGKQYFGDWLANVALLRARVQTQASEISTRVGFAYFIWRNPWMVAGSRTYISHLLSEGGAQNLYPTTDKLEERYPTIEPKKFRRDADEESFHCLGLFSSEPFNFKLRHIDEFCKLSGNANTSCMLVDGKALSWHGVRLRQGYEEVLRIQQFAKGLIESTVGSVN